MANRKWECRITAKSPDGRRMNRRVEAAGDVHGAMLRALRARKDGGRAFFGCKVTACTPLGQILWRVVMRDGEEIVLWPEN